MPVALCRTIAASVAPTGLFASLAAVLLLSAAGIAGYEIPAEAQAEVLSKRCGDGWIDAARAWSRKNAAVR